MLLAYRIPLITGIILILTVIVNIGSFQYLSAAHLREYLQSYESTGLAPDPEKLKAFIELSRLDRSTQDEYAQIIAELSNLSTSLENIGQNPELYMSHQSGASDEMISLPYPSIHSGALDMQRLFPILNLRAFGKDTAEGKFVTGVLGGLLSINLIWLSIIALFYFFWIRSIFFPIQTIIENLENIIGGKKYEIIQYQKQNEFHPLITTINSLHKSLSIQEKIRSDFLADISHEIRTPITAVKCYIDAIEDGMITLDKQTLPLLQQELNRLTDITGRIMDYEYLARESFEDIRIERFCARQHILPIIREYTPQLEKNDQQIRLEYPQECFVRMDNGMYLQILHNIFSNFIKYAGPGSTLVCAYENDASFDTFTFSDDGIGIPESEIDFVKEKFYRVDKGRSQSEKSMGIGLSIIDRIAKLHHGEFRVKKNSPKGVIFEVKIGRGQLKN